MQENYPPFRCGQYNDERILTFTPGITLNDIVKKFDGFQNVECRIATDRYHEGDVEFRLNSCYTVYVSLSFNIFFVSWNGGSGWAESIRIHQRCNGAFCEMDMCGNANFQISRAFGDD